MSSYNSLVVEMEVEGSRGLALVPGRGSAVPAGSSAVLGEAQPSRDELVRNLMKMPGLGSTALQALGAVGIETWADLGSLTELEFKFQMCRLSEKYEMRPKFPADMRDEKRLGPGHLNSLDELYKKARNEISRGSARESAPRSASASTTISRRAVCGSPPRRSRSLPMRSRSPMPSSSARLSLQEKREKCKEEPHCRFCGSRLRNHTDIRVCTRCGELGCEVCMDDGLCHTCFVLGYQRQGFPGAE
jgi:hypothetical protein